MFFPKNPLKSEESESTISLAKCNFNSDNIILADSHLSGKVEIKNSQSMILTHAYDVEKGQNSDMVILYSIEDRIMCRIQVKSVSRIFEKSTSL